MIELKYFIFNSQKGNNTLLIFVYELEDEYWFLEGLLMKEFFLSKF